MLAVDVVVVKGMLPVLLVLLLVSSLGQTRSQTHVHT